MKVYICGDKSDRKRFKQAERMIKEEGNIPINPIRIIYALPPEVNKADFTIVAYELIHISDAVYCLDGWQNDLTARMEMAYAKRNDMKILEGGKTSD